MGKKILIGLILVNLLGVFAPEVGFDALWYHLTLPKLFLMQGRWYYPGGLLYYSVMPRLAETLFIPLLILFGTLGPKLLQYLAGIGSMLLTYKIAQKYFKNELALLASLIFYGTWLVAWQSGSAYVDLIRTFFETLALFFLLNKKKLYAGLAFGLAIGVKWHALGSLLIYAVIFSPFIIPPALFISLPWFLIAFHFTKNPVYPLFESFMTQTQLDQVSRNFFSISSIIKRLFLSPFSLSWPIDDPLNPLLSFLFVFGAYHLFRQRNQKLYPIFKLSLAGLFFWQLTPPPSSRYLLPFLPAIAIISTLAFKTRFSRWLKMGLYFSLMSLICLRLVINVRNLKTDISTRLPADTFYDVDQYVSRNISSRSKVLVDVWHNLYYLPVNYDHVTWADPSQKYDYLITKNQDQAKIKGVLIHTNSLGAQIFKLND